MNQDIVMILIPERATDLNIFIILILFLRTKQLNERWQNVTATHFVSAIVNTWKIRKMWFADVLVFVVTVVNVIAHVKMHKI